MSSFAVQVAPPPTPAVAAEPVTPPTLQEQAMSQLGEPLSLETVAATRITVRARDAAKSIEQIKTRLKGLAASGARFDVYEAIKIGDQPVTDKQHAEFILELAKPQFPGFKVELYSSSNNHSLHVSEPT